MLAAIERERVTVFPAVPFIFHTLAETRRAERADLPSLRLCFSAGAPLSQETFDLFHDRFGTPDPPAVRVQRGGLGHDQPRRRSDGQLAIRSAGRCAASTSSSSTRTVSADRRGETR